MAGSANDLSRNAEKLQHGTKNRHRTQPQTNRVHILVGENGHAKSLICHTEWSDQRQENDVIELIRASFSCCRPVFGDLPCDRSNVRFGHSVVCQISYTQTTHAYGTHSPPVCHGPSFAIEAVDTHYTTLSDSSFAHHSRCFRLHPRA